MRYPTLQHIRTIIRRFNRTHDTKITIINKGQLEFALAKPIMNIYGKEQYPLLYQKAAALMEAITKVHALSDGNKRIAMMTAETMIEMNGGHLVLPLKSIRLSVDTAMDHSDERSEILQRWFKVHIAKDAYTLCAMLYELDEEEGVIQKLLKQGREDDTTHLLDRWMVFDNYPANRQACGELINQWKIKQEKAAVKDAPVRYAADWRAVWDTFMIMRSMPHPHHDSSTEHSGNVNELQYNHNDMRELQAAEERIHKEVIACTKTADASRVLQNALRLERHGMHDYAIGMFEKLRGLDNDESHAVFHIAMNIQYGLGDAESALKYWDMHLKYPPVYHAAHLHRGLALAMVGRHADALTSLEKVPDEYRGTDIYKGRIYASMNQHERAIEFYMVELSRSPDNVDAYGLMGVSYASMGDDRHALECFDSAIRIRPDYQAHYNRGTTLANMKRYDDAITDYRKALAANPDHVESRINMASTMSNFGRPKDAIPHFIDALDVDPDNHTALYSLAVTLARTERYEEALIHIDRAVELYPHDMDAKYLKGSILAHLGRDEECLKYIAKADPDFREGVDPGALQKRFGAILNDKRFRNQVR